MWVDYWGFFREDGGDGVEFVVVIEGFLDWLGNKEVFNVVDNIVGLDYIVGLDDLGEIDGFNVGIIMLF